MRIHSDVFTCYEDFSGTISAAGMAPEVMIWDYSEHKSTKRARGFEIRLAADPGRDSRGKARRPRNDGQYGAEQSNTIKAATYDEHGEWIAELFEIDPDAIIGPYSGADNFHKMTRDKYLVRIAV